MERRSFIALLSGAASWPLAARAQQKAMPVIGYLHFGSPGPFAYQLVTFRQGLAQNGYVEGQNVAIETRWAEGHNDRLPTLAADLVAREVNVIYAGGPPAAVAAKRSRLSSRSASTRSRPASLPVWRVRAQISRLQYYCRRFDAEATGAAFRASSRGQAVCPAGEPRRSQPRDQRVRGSGAREGVAIGHSEGQQRGRDRRRLRYPRRLAADALVIGDAVFFTFRREQLVALAARYRLPTIERWHEFAAAGGLISYGPSLVDAARQVGIYVGRILKVKNRPIFPSSSRPSSS